MFIHYTFIYIKCIVASSYTIHALVYAVGIIDIEIDIDCMDTFIRAAREVKCFKMTIP